MGKGTLDGAHTYRDGLMALSASGLGYTYLREGKSDPALAAYRQAWQIVHEYPTIIAQDRHSVRALAGLAASYVAQGEPEHSKELLSHALEKLAKAERPQSRGAGANLADLYYAISVAHARAGNTTEALDSLEKANHAGWLDEGWLERDLELRVLPGLARFSSRKFVSSRKLTCPLCRQNRENPKVQSSF